MAYNLFLMKAYDKGQDLWMSHIVFDNVKNVIQIAVLQKVTMQSQTQKFESKFCLLKFVTEIM